MKSALEKDFIIRTTLPQGRRETCEPMVGCEGLGLPRELTWIFLLEPQKTSCFNCAL